MKKLLLTAGVAGLMLFSAVGCGSTCCSRSSTSNACPTPACPPATSVTPVTPVTPPTTSGKPLVQSQMGGGVGSPATAITLPVGGTDTPIVMPSK